MSVLANNTLLSTPSSSFYTCSGDSQYCKRGFYILSNSTRFFYIRDIHLTSNYFKRFQVFHCVHFECPAQFDDKSPKSPTQRGHSSTSDGNNALPPPPPEVATEAVHIDSDE